MNEEIELARVVNGSWCVSKEQLDYFVNLEKENQQLKEDNEILRENYLRAIKLLKENRKLKEDIKAYEQERNNLINSIPFKENKKLKTNWNELKKYIDNNKMILNNPHIFQYYLIQEEILKGDSNEC